MFRLLEKKDGGELKAMRQRAAAIIAHPEDY